MDLKTSARDFFQALQDSICRRLEELEGKHGSRFREDRWTHDVDGASASGGGGITRVLAGGRIFERAGVNLADVNGELTERLAARLEVEAQGFRATGISLVIHPLSPMVPAAHMNLRYLELAGGKAWFGGGADLTPYYLFDDDAVHFHRTLCEACDRHDEQYYPRFKKACDEYFFLTHRAESRGVGGIFFDYLSEDLPTVFRFVQDAGRAFSDAYLPIVERRRDLPWWERERDWQLVRRGRYVEFNLVQDRGTLFGLETRGRTESILMSMPPLARWVYDRQPEPGSREERLLAVLREPRDWLGGSGGPRAGF